MSLGRGAIPFEEVCFRVIFMAILEPVDKIIMVLENNETTVEFFSTFEVPLHYLLPHLLISTEILNIMNFHLSDEKCLLN